MLDLVRLRVLAAVAEHGSVTEAARKLHYSQPSVSQHLAKLEAETGALLVQRVGRGIRLTEAGRLLADRAVTILGPVDAAVGFRYADTDPDEAGARITHLLDDPTYLLTNSPGEKLSDYRGARWIGGCDRHRDNLLALCARDGFTPNIAFHTDDVAVTQAMVAAGMGVAIAPGLAIREHVRPGVCTTELPDSNREVYAATYGEPPDPPPTAALLAALTAVA